MQTIFVIAVTSILTAFFSNLLAPRLNAWFEQKQQDKKILKKTLRTLLEIEIYVQRRLKHPSITLFSQEFNKRVKKFKNISKEQLAAFNLLFSGALENLAASSNLLPDNSESLDNEFTAILSELSTVDPLLAYQMSERHIISPIQQMKAFAINAAHSFEITTSEADIQKFNEFAQPLQNAVIDELLSDLRTDILTVAQKIGRIMLWRTMSFYTKREIKRKNDREKMTAKLFEEFAKSAKAQKEASKNNSKKS